MAPVMLLVAVIDLVVLREPAKEDEPVPEMVRLPALDRVNRLVPEDEAILNRLAKPALPLMERVVKGEAEPIPTN